MPRFVGQISLFPFTFEPAEWIFCDGRLLSISENEVLFTRLRNTFGGDGQTSFGVPDLRAIAPKNCQYCISLFGEYKPDVYQLLLGQTMISAFSPDTRGLLECAGQSLLTARYRSLETLMGTRFGGDGANNFNLPDLRSKAPAKCSYMMAVEGTFPGSRMEDIFVGELLLLPYELQEQVSQDLRLCNGDLLQIERDRALFSLLGNRFGGDGKQNFALPDLRSVAPSKFNYYICVRGVLPPRS